MSHFQPGDTVTLGPDGLPMTVEGINNTGDIVVSWWCKGTLYKGTFEMWRLVSESDVQELPVLE